MSTLMPVQVLQQTKPSSPSSPNSAASSKAAPRSKGARPMANRQCPHPHTPGTGDQIEIDSRNPHRHAR